MKKIIIVMLAIMLAAALVNAHEEDLEAAKQIIGNKAACADLSDDQMESLGEYYMEQMHPGEAHELMHQMMGLEDDTEEEEQFHINMAKRLYCNEDVEGFGMMGNGMMNCGMMGEKEGMMNRKGGMMNMMGGTFGYGMMGSGMTGSYGYLGFLNV